MIAFGSFTQNSYVEVSKVNPLNFLPV